MKIGEVAKAAGVGIDAVRFYEREGLLPEPARRPSGYREYSPEAVMDLRFIKRAKDLGFSLKETSELLSIDREADATVGADDRMVVAGDDFGDGTPRRRSVGMRIEAGLPIGSSLRRLRSHLVHRRFRQHEKLLLDGDRVDHHEFEAPQDRSGHRCRKRGYVPSQSICHSIDFRK